MSEPAAVETTTTDREKMILKFSDLELENEIEKFNNKEMRLKSSLAKNEKEIEKLKNEVVGLKSRLEKKRAERMQAEKRFAKLAKAPWS